MVSAYRFTASPAAAVGASGVVLPFGLGPKRAARMNTEASTVSATAIAISRVDILIRRVISGVSSFRIIMGHMTR